MTERFTPDMTKALVSPLGEDGARAYFAKYPELDPSMDKTYPEVQPDDVDAYYVNPSAFKKNLGGKSSALAVEGAPDAPAAAAAPAMGGPEEGGPMAALNARVEAYQKRVTDLRKQQFDAAEKTIAAQRAGPGVGERLAQLSAAFASPTRTRGFGGMMANVMPVMAKQQEEERLGKTALADKLQALRDKYASGQVEDEGDALKYQVELEKLRAEQDKAANSMGQWSDTIHRFVPKDKAVAIGTGKVPVGGIVRTYADFTDGTRHVDLGDGTWGVYDQVGNLLGHADALGNKTDGTGTK